jgi:hypothetical protein
MEKKMNKMMGKKTPSVLITETTKENNKTKTQSSLELDRFTPQVTRTRQSIFKTSLEKGDKIIEKINKAVMYSSDSRPRKEIKSFPELHGKLNIHGETPNKGDEKNIIINLEKKDECYRQKTFTVEYILNWYEKNSLITPKLLPRLTNNIEFQSNILIDEIKVLLENIQHYRLKYLGDKFLLRVFKNLDVNKQIRLNKILEETCGLILKIANGILLDFANFLEKFISVQPPHPEKLLPKLVKDEVINFRENVNFLTEITTFLKSCYDVYLTLIKQIDDMILPYNSFKTIMQYLARARLNISNLICSTDNYKTNYRNDLKAIYKYKLAINKLYGKKEDEEKLKAEECEMMRYLATNDKKVFSVFKINDESERRRRLNRVLNK